MTIYFENRLKISYVEICQHFETLVCVLLPNFTTTSAELPPFLFRKIGHHEPGASHRIIKFYFHYFIRNELYGFWYSKHPSPTNLLFSLPCGFRPWRSGFWSSFWCDFQFRKNNHTNIYSQFPRCIKCCSTLITFITI
jgi:hypothetical protein